MIGRPPPLPPGKHYRKGEYANAIRHATDLADRKAHEADDQLQASVRVVPRWSPNQLRHSAATEIRSRYGLEAVQTVLGHAKADVTQIYAERNEALAASVASMIG